MKQRLDWRSRYVPLLAVVGMLLVGATLARAEETEAQRRERIRRMDAAQKEQLRRRCEQFDHMDKEERRRIRDLHESLRKHPKQDELRRVMHRYYEWLKTLSPGERAELRDLKGAARIARIKELQGEQHRRDRFRHRGSRGSLTRDDVKEVSKWLREYAKTHEKTLLAAMSEEARRRFDNAKESDRDRNLALHAFMPRMRQRQPWKLPAITPEEYERLAERLSEKSAKKLRETKPEQREGLLKGWLFQVGPTLYGRSGFGMRRSSPSKEQLQQVYDKLDKRRQEQLMELPREQMQRELRRMYYYERFRPGRRGGPRGGPPRDGRCEVDRLARDHHMTDIRAKGHRAEVGRLTATNEGRESPGRMCIRTHVFAEEVEYAVEVGNPKHEILNKSRVSGNC